MSIQRDELQSRTSAAAADTMASDAARCRNQMVALFGSLSVLAYIPVALLALWMNGALGTTGGWAKGTFILAGPGLIVAGFIWRTDSFRSARAAGAVGAACVFGFSTYAGTALARYSPPDPDRLGHTLDEVGVPDRWVLVSDTGYGGGCFDYCPGRSRTYAAPGDPSAAMAQFVERLDGSSLTIDSATSHAATGHGEKRSLAVDAYLHLPPGESFGAWSRINITLTGLSS